MTTGQYFIIAGLALIVFSPIIRSIEQLTRGVYDMSDAQTQALADLTAVVQAVADQVVLAATALSNTQPDDSAAIEAQVTKLHAAVDALKAAAAPAPLAPAAPAA